MKDSFQSTFTRLWLGPVAIAIASSLALYLALVFDGFIDVIAGITLITVGLIGLNLFRAQPK